MTKSEIYGEVETIRRNLNRLKSLTNATYAESIVLEDMLSRLFYYEKMIQERK